MSTITEIIPKDMPEFAQESFDRGQYFAESLTPSWAMTVLAKNFRDDPDYAYSWHCNLAMAFYDSMNDIDHESRHRAANEAAGRVMKAFFDIETTYIVPEIK